MLRHATPIIFACCAATRFTILIDVSLQLSPDAFDADDILFSLALLLMLIRYYAARAFTQLLLRAIRAIRVMLTILPLVTACADIARRPAKIFH